MTEDLNGISRPVYCHHVDEYLVSFLLDTQPERGVHGLKFFMGLIGDFCQDLDIFFDRLILGSFFLFALVKIFLGMSFFGNTFQMIDS